MFYTGIADYYARLDADGWRYADPDTGRLSKPFDNYAELLNAARLASWIREWE